jgi:hypothetical protein
VDSATVQREIGAVISILEDAIKSKDMSGLEGAIARLTKLQELCATASLGIGGFPGGPPLFHKGDVY